MPVDPTKVVAIDVHVHAEVSCHDPEDPVMAKYLSLIHISEPTRH